MLIGKYKGDKVEDAKPKVKQDLIDEGLAFVYNEQNPKLFLDLVMIVVYHWKINGILIMVKKFGWVKP